MNETRRHQRGHIFLKGPSWYLRYYVQEFQSDGTARLVQRCRKLADNRGAYRSKKAVKSLADDFLRPFNDGTVTLDSSLSITVFWAQKYLPFITGNKRPSTVNGYQKMWKTYLEARLDVPLRDFRTVDCDRLLQAIAREHGIGTTTLKHVKHLLSGIFRYALRTGVLHGINPVQAACIPPAHSGRATHAYTLRVILRILRVLPQPAKAVVAIAAFAGLRRGELRSLRREDYDGSFLKVQRAAWRQHLEEPKGKRGRGTLPLIPAAASVVDEYLAAVQPKKYLFNPLRDRPADLDYLVRTVIRPTLERHALPWYGLHAFRRGLATNLHELGVPDIVIQAILRHSDVSVTRKAYIKNDGVDQRSLQAMEMLQAAVCNQYATGAGGENGEVAVN